MRAPLSSSFGSTPIARRSVFAELLRKTIAGRKTVVNAHWNGMTSFAVCRGSESAKFFGTSSPTIIDRSVAATIAVTEPTGRTAASGRPSAVSGPASKLEIAGSIVYPVRSVVSVMPSCALERCVEVILSAEIVGPSRFSPRA